MEEICSPWRLEPSCARRQAFESTHLVLHLTSDIELHFREKQAHPQPAWAPRTGTDYSMDGNPISVVVGDLNRDGAADFVVVSQTDNNVPVFLNTGAGD